VVSTNVTRFTGPGHASSRAPAGFVSPWDIYVLSRDGKLYHADLQQRTIQVISASPWLRSAALIVSGSEAGQGPTFLVAARTQESIRVFDSHGKELRRYPVPEELRDRDLSVAETTRGEVLMRWHTPDDDLATSNEHRIALTGPAGPCRQWTTSLAKAPTLPVEGFALVAPSPLLLASYITAAQPKKLLARGAASSYSEAVLLALSEAASPLAIAQVLSAWLAFLCYRRQVRYGITGARRIIWPIFVLFLGLPGWIGYRFGMSWPVLEKCPACGCPTPQDREACVRCDSEASSQVVFTGTEVFA
jgi:hypothetical protein